MRGFPFREAPVKIAARRKDMWHHRFLVNKGLRRSLLGAILVWGLNLSSLNLPAQGSPEAGTGEDLTTAIIQVAKKAIPAVAHIEVTERQEVAAPFLPFESDPFFRRFFGVPQMPKKFRREVKGLGSGILMDAQGHILTNHHVVGGATKLEVTLADGSKYEARLVGTDPKTDLAVIKIEAKEPLPYLPFGDSDKVEVGEWVVAIGHPRGLDQTVTQGIISAKHRRGVTDPGNYQDFLQTDAAINPGNSGGPLLNLKGEVIGVNAAIASQTGGFEGIGFTIPSNMALHVAKQLISNGKVLRGWLGVNVQDLTPELAQKLGLKAPRGALVADVVKGGPADQAGVKKGDVVLTFGGKQIIDGSSLRNEVAATPPGQNVKLELLREAQRKELTVKVGNLEDAAAALLSSIKERLGVEVRPVSQVEAERYGTDPEVGVTITWVDPKGPMGKAGLEVRDILLGIEGQDIRGVEGLMELLGSIKPRQRVTFIALDHRTGNTGLVEVAVR